MTDWQDMIIGDRMTVDREFSSRVENSQFSRQEWGLIMTSVTFEIENPDDEAAAEIVADTTKLPGMMPEIEKISEMDPMAGPQNRSNSGGGKRTVKASGLQAVDDGRRHVRRRRVAAEIGRSRAVFEDGFNGVSNRLRFGVVVEVF